MPTIISHAIAAVALITAFPVRAVPRRLMLVGAGCSMVPDLDVIGFRFDVQYGDLLGHRGLSHSLFFAGVLASLVLFVALPRLKPNAHRGVVWLYLFLATASHGVLDALTNGGLGVAFFSPFDTTRYFFPLTPIAVSPIGANFFSNGGLSVLFCEFYWVWLPSIAFAAIAFRVRNPLIRPSISK
jgi:inner membrane protein